MSETNTQILYTPPISNWNPSSFFTCLCNLLERGENRRKNCRKKRKYCFFLFEEDPTKSTPLFPPPCDLHTVHFSSNTIRLLFFFCETETSKDQRQKKKIRRKKKGVTAVKQQQLTTLAHTLQPIGYKKEPLAPAHPNQIISFLSQKSHDHGRLVTRGERINIQKKKKKNKSQFVGHQIV